MPGTRSHGRRAAILRHSCMFNQRRHLYHRTNSLYTRAPWRLNAQLTSHRDGSNPSRFGAANVRVVCRVYVYADTRRRVEVLRQWHLLVQIALDGGQSIGRGQRDDRLPGNVAAIESIEETSRADGS